MFLASRAKGDARDEGGVPLLRRPERVVEDAVDPIADDDRRAERFDVDVGGALLDRLHDHRVDEADDRRVVGGVPELGDVVLVRDLADFAPEMVIAGETIVTPRRAAEGSRG